MRESSKKAQKRYLQSEKGKEALLRYRLSEKGQEAQRQDLLRRRLRTAFYHWRQTNINGSIEDFMRTISPKES